MSTQKINNKQRQSNTLVFAQYTGAKQTFTAYNSSPLSVSVTVNGTEYINVYAIFNHGSTNASSNFGQIQFLQDGIQINQASGAVGIPGVDGATSQVILLYRFQPTAGTHTYSITLASYRGNGTAYIYPDGNNFISIERD